MLVILISLEIGFNSVSLKEKTIVSIYWSVPYLWDRRVLLASFTTIQCGPTIDKQLFIRMKRFEKWFPSQGWTCSSMGFNIISYCKHLIQRGLANHFWILLFVTNPNLACYILSRKMRTENHSHNIQFNFCKVLQI